MISFDTWQKRQRETRRKALNAKCPHCERNVLDTLEESARESSYGSQSPSTIFECPHCEEEIEFELEWETVLCWAMPVTEETKP